MDAEKLTAQEVLSAKVKEPFTGREMLNAKLKEPLPPPVAAGPGGAGNQKIPDRKMPEEIKYIGVRVTGGISEPVLAMLPDGKLVTRPEAPGKTYIRTAFQGARTADLMLFAGNNAYIEKTKPYGRYIISGMTNPQQKNSFQLELQAEPNGKMDVIAYEQEPGAKPGKGEYKHKLTVDKYSRSALDRLEASGQLGQSSTEGQVRTPGFIPAEPSH